MSMDHSHHSQLITYQGTYPHTKQIYSNKQDNIWYSTTSLATYVALPLSEKPQSAGSVSGPMQPVLLV